MDNGSTGLFYSLRFPVLDKSDHVLVTRVFELPDTICCTLVTLFSRFKHAEPLHIDRVAPVRLKDRGELGEDNLCTRMAARCLGREVPVHDFSAPIPIPFGDAD